MMKRFFICIAALLASLAISFAQTPEEIIGRMDAEMAKADQMGMTMTKETDSAWYFDCKKSKSNTKKDDPKKMSLIVAKSNYMPLDLTAKMKGVTVSIRNASIGVSEKEVTFDASKFPGATVNDKR